jgi:hypothetical protein
LGHEDGSLAKSQEMVDAAQEDLELDYKLVCQIVEELKREGRLELL